MKKILFFGFLIISVTVKAQINVDFNTDTLPAGWNTTEGVFEISNAEIYPICQQNSLIASVFEEESVFAIQTQSFDYTGGNIEVQLTFGIKDLYHALGINTAFQRPNIFMQFAAGNSESWTEFGEIPLEGIEESTSCIDYTTIVNPGLLQDFQTIKFRFLYKSPLQTGVIYLLYWSIDKIKITIDTNCVIPSEPVGSAAQSLPAGSVVSDIEVTGQNLKWYSDIGLTQTITADDLLENDTMYYVTQTINGCESAAFAINIQLILNVSDFDINALKAYPNPVDTVLNISSDEYISVIKIFNMLGQEVLLKQINNNIAKLDMTNLPAGNYILKCASGTGNKNIKVIKQ